MQQDPHQLAAGMAAPQGVTPESQVTHCASNRPYEAR